MTIKVKVYQPDLRIMLYKTIKRTTLDGQTPVSERYKGINQPIELTPYLSEQRGIRTSKSLRDPAGGFSITLADKPYKQDGAFETLAGVIESMDYIEIRMRHDPPDLIGNLIADADADATRPPIVLRGFVSEITRTETMGADGRPQRSVIINGQDYGKLWQMLQILYFPGYVIGQDILSNFKLYERFGAGFKTTQTAAEFVSEVISKIVNPYLKGLMPENTSHPKEIKTDIRVKHGTTSVTGPQNQEGAVYDLLKTYGDVGVWNELFIEDREDGVYCVYRPNPSKDVNGKSIYPQVFSDKDYEAPPTIDLPGEDVLSLTLSRSDANVANFYWVRAPRFELNSNVEMQLFAIQGADRDTVLTDTYQNSAMALYGTRVMYGQTQQGGDDIATFNSGLPASEDKKRTTDITAWIRACRTFMLQQNKDNILLEHGTMRIRGNEQIRPGMFVRLVRGSFAAEYYVVQVEHEYVPFGGFFSTLTVERGMGFVERVKRGGGADSPYLAELQEQ